MVTWQAEEMIGKQSIMLDLKSESGKKVMRQLLTKADVALANKMDEQLETMGIGRSTLDSIVENGGKGPKIIQLQVAARRGEETKGVQAANWSGYDPALQGKTGLMRRFGPEGCPTYHGVASCVDYLCGYTGCFAGVTALYAREAHGVLSECAGTSLACCSTLVQFNMQGGETHPTEGAVVRGPRARGRTALNRIYQVGYPETPENANPEHWIYAQAKRDLTAEAQAFKGSRDDFIKELSKEGILATPVHTCKQVAAVSKTKESKSLQFEKREAEGLLTETWKPTWFCFNGVPSSCPGAAAPSGVHAPRILMEVCGYQEAEVHDMYAKGIVLPIYWDKSSSDTGTDVWKEAHVWPGEDGKSKKRRGMDPNNFVFGNQIGAAL
jgi:crotonobetainyl-CoA:carnitine CoA-transferase CaiB-like acyl-CoA transferase